jgi:hypothetical protein
VIDYIAEAERYRPPIVTTLLIGEAPPPSGQSYFYLPRPLSNHLPIEDDRSLPATIFHHYFRTRPGTRDEYVDLLGRLKDRGIFLVDICDEPVKVRGCPEGVERIKVEIPRLRATLDGRGLAVPEESMVFLLARGNYTAQIRQSFPRAARVRWIDFRLNCEPGPRSGPHHG